MLEHVAAHHLTRLACLYVRQSTLQQVMENTESTSRQYALRERVRALGWADERIIVIDQSLGMVRAERRMGQEVTRETCYYLISFSGVKTFAHAVCSHWSIENCVHWVLVMAFREDESRIREGHAQKNLAVLRYLTLNLLRREKTAYLGIRVKRLKAARNIDYLQRILETVI